MEERILGLHHITAIAGDAKRNLDFYTKVLGQRLVKKTVNFDDPGTYHFYFGNEVGTPGTILTFFPWKNVRKGYNGSGMATSIGYSVPKDSLQFWIERFNRFNVKHGQIEERWGESLLSFEDPDGLKIELIISNKEDGRKPWETDETKSDVAVKGFNNVTLTVNDVSPTASIITDIFGYQLVKQENKHYLFVTNAVEGASTVNIIEAPNLPHGLNAGGTNHHVAFCVKDENVLMDFREKIESAGLNATPKIDRDYFFSVYFREPGGVLFELATKNPGFSKDEPVEKLGSSLKLPTQYEGMRREIEKTLPAL